MEKLKFCLLAECNEMVEVVDSDSYKTPVLVWLKYLAIYYMKSLTCIWNGPFHNGSLSNLKTLVISACPELRTVLTHELLDNLACLEYLIVDDCNKVKSLVSLESYHYHSSSTRFLPRLKKISLVHLPDLVTLCNGPSIAPRLESLVVYDCPNFEKLPYMEVSDYIKEIKGENEWWNALEWCEPEWTSGQPDYLTRVFIPLDIDGDVMDELECAVNNFPDVSD